MAGSPPNPSNRIIKVSIISDIVCPWCFICTREVLAAIDRLKLTDDSPVKFELEHKPYLLNPSWADDESYNMTEHFHKNVGKERWEQVQKVLDARGAEVGVKFHCDGFMCSTLRAHRLLHLAWQKGGSKMQTNLLDALYRGCFEQSANVSDLAFLSTKAEESGLMSRPEAIEFLKSDEMKVEVHRMVSCGQRNGIRGVPFTVIDGRWAISGGQPSEVFYKIFEKLVRGEEPILDAQEHPPNTC